MSCAVGPPESEAELLTRAQALAGRPLSHLARAQGRSVPPNLRHAKGWVGQLLERALGAMAGSKPAPDFEHLSLELKTIPIDRLGRPRESTYVCAAPLTELKKAEWEDSLVHAKLGRVLWMPVEADPNIPLAARKVGSPLIWSPDAEEEAKLKRDWEDLVNLICEGYVESITGHRGRVLQLRPKAADSAQRTWGVDDDGDPIRTLPRGFYLRRRFTQGLLAKHFILGR